MQVFVFILGMLAATGLAGVGTLLLGGSSGMAVAIAVATLVTLQVLYVVVLLVMARMRRLGREPGHRKTGTKTSLTTQLEIGGGATNRSSGPQG